MCSEGDIGCFFVSELGTWWMPSCMSWLWHCQFHITLWFLVFSFPSLTLAIRLPKETGLFAVAVNFHWSMVALGDWFLTPSEVWGCFPDIYSRGGIRALLRCRCRATAHLSLHLTARQSVWTGSPVPWPFRTLTQATLSLGSQAYSPCCAVGPGQ